MSMGWRQPIVPSAIAACAILASVFAMVLDFGGFPESSAANVTRLAQAPAPEARQQSQSQVVMPSAKQIVLLTRTALLTLNDAVRTGNYTVLHDVGAPSFREENPPERLADIFATLDGRADLALVAIMVPQIAEAPILNQEAGLLRLVGSFPTRPMQIDFVLIFQAVAGQWRLFGISVDTSPTAAATEQGQVTGTAPANAAGGGPGSGPPVPKRNPDAIR